MRAPWSVMDYSQYIRNKILRCHQLQHHVVVHRASKFRTSTVHHPSVWDLSTVPPPLSGLTQPLQYFQVQHNRGITWIIWMIFSNCLYIYSHNQVAPRLHSWTASAVVCALYCRYPKVGLNSYMVTYQRANFPLWLSSFETITEACSVKTWKGYPYVKSK